MNIEDNRSPATRRQGVVAVCRIDARFLVIRRSDRVEAPLAYCFPGGAIESGESEPAALSREMQEELQCQAEPIRRLWSSCTAWEVELAWWLVRLPDSSQLKANPREVASIHWFTEDELRLLPELLSSNTEFLDAWREGRFTLPE